MDHSHCTESAKATESLDIGSPKAFESSLKQPTTQFSNSVYVNLGLRCEWYVG